MSQRFYLPIPQIFTDLGTLAPGWKLYFYRTLTTTPLAVYSDTALTVPLPNPVLTNNEGHLVDGSGNITSIYFSDASLYKAVLEDENGVEQWTADPCDPFTVSLAVLNPRPLFYAGTTTGTSAAYVLAANPAFSSYSSSDIFELTFHTACAAGATLKYVATGAALNLMKKTGQGTKVALLAGDVEGRHQVTNDGVDIIVLDPRTPISYLGTTPTITIAGGVATLPNNTNHYLIDGESAAADTLDTVNGLTDGQEATFQIVSSARPITISLSGNFLTPTGEALLINDTTTQIKGFFRGSDSKFVIQNDSRPRVYAPANQTITSSGTLTLAHGLGKAPDLVRFTLVCTGNEFGYVVGDEIILSSGEGCSSGADNFGFVAQIDATNIIILYGANAAVFFNVLNKTTRTAAAGTLTNANWVLKVRAFLFT